MKVHEVASCETGDTLAQLNYRRYVLSNSLQQAQFRNESEVDISIQSTMNVGHGKAKLNECWEVSTVAK